MKAHYFITSILLMLFTLSISAQNGFNYKAIIKDSNGNVISNSSVTVQFTILQGAAQTNVYQEIHTPTTDANGIIIINIGEGVPNSGVFNDIDWGSDTHFLNTQINTGNGLVDMGTTQFKTVPYALSAGNAATKIDELSDGRSYSNGYSIFLGVDAGLNDNGSDNANVGVGFNALKSNISGIGNTAIGLQSLYQNTGYNNTATGAETLFLNSTGYWNNAYGSQALFSNSMGNENTAIGAEVLLNNTTGSFNTAIGNSAGIKNETGSGNIFLGYQSGYNETGSNKLYIENSNADANNALIYGEFDTNILRTNSEFQIGNPSLTGYSFPTSDGSNNQLLITDGVGGLSWINSISLGSQKINDLSDAKSNPSGSSIFLGVDAGLNDNGSDNANVGVGFNALKSNISGTINVAVGSYALEDNTTGEGNTAVGIATLQSNNGSRNSAFGSDALWFNASGNDNTAIGKSALFENWSGSKNSVFGSDAGANNIVGSGNIFLGYRSGYNETGSNKLYIENSNADANNALIYGEFDTNILRTNSEFQIGNPSLTGYSFPTSDGSNNQLLITDGVGGLSWASSSTLGSQKINDLSDAKSDANGSSIFLGIDAGLNDDGSNNENVGLGFAALKNTSTGRRNTAVGYNSLNLNTTGEFNTAVGAAALLNNNGDYNTAVGRNALTANTSGTRNTATGYAALELSTGNNNTAFGRSALSGVTTGSNNTSIGYDAQVPSATGSNQVRIGNALVTYAGVQVAWTVTSDRRWKDQIRELPYGLETVLQLKPVDYIRKNNELKTREIGFIAQDVEILLDKIGYNDQGILSKDDEGNLSLRYNDFIPLLTKALQEQQDIIESLKATVENQESEIDGLTATIEPIQKRLLKIEQLILKQEQIVKTSN